MKKKYIFIDTNIYLDFYRVSKGDLNKLGILRNGFADPDIANKFVLCVNMQNRDEYYRNRVNVIVLASSLSKFRIKWRVWCNLSKTRLGGCLIIRTLKLIG